MCKHNPQYIGHLKDKRRGLIETFVQLSARMIFPPLKQVSEIASSYLCVNR